MLYKTFSTSPHSCHCITLLNTKMLNFYTTLNNNLLLVTEIHFIEPSVKVNEAYYRDNFLLKNSFQTYSGYSRLGFCLSTGRCTDAVTFLDRKVRVFISPTLWSPNSPDLNPDDYSIWSVGLMQEKIYRSRIANVNELEMCLIDEWRRFDQSIIDAAIASSDAVISALVAMGRGIL